MLSLCWWCEEKLRTLAVRISIVNDMELLFSLIIGECTPVLAPRCKFWTTVTLWAMGWCDWKSRCMSSRCWFPVDSGGIGSHKSGG